jgi:ABC-type lipoprotein release transport system permease subunit
MFAIWETLHVVAQIAIRNLFASRWKTLIVGGIIGFGALLVVAGTSLLDGVDRAMSRSIIGSVAGHIQVYSSKSKDELEVMGGFSLDSGDLSPLDLGQNQCRDDSADATSIDGQKSEVRHVVSPCACESGGAGAPAICSGSHFMRVRARRRRRLWTPIPTS